MTTYTIHDAAVLWCGVVVRNAYIWRRRRRRPRIPYSRALMVGLPVTGRREEFMAHARTRNIGISLFPAARAFAGTIYMYIYVFRAGTVARAAVDLDVDVHYYCLHRGARLSCSQSERSVR